MWQAFRPEPWSPATHRHFPAAFLAAVRALLLAANRRPVAAPALEPRARRQRSEGEEERPWPAGASLADLDSLVLLNICEHAAHPLSAWLDV